MGLRFGWRLGPHMSMSVALSINVRPLDPALVASPEFWNERLIHFAIQIVVFFLVWASAQSAIGPNSILYAAPLGWLAYLLTGIALRRGLHPLTDGERAALILGGAALAFLAAIFVAVILRGQ
jgi:hypothetical protein